MSHHLAQLNIATLLAPLDSPQLTDFVANLDQVNTLAEQSPGFVWRLKDDTGDATALRPYGDDVLVNMSVWTDAEALADFVYRSSHTEIMRRRRDWFAAMREAHMVLWWIPAGHVPTVNEAAERLSLLQREGPSPAAFSFRQRYPAPATAAPVLERES
ncbi:DUF3291 domain-containing protein [Chitinolyticbacter meiyuanensis]|uniref:DUF3291 domain-containing protein n=1 Tax=Chitinolyticbacter meiyuanensis TaxID=682798 RepID=UPI0011E601A3|nr:DUF3291 domain-containing protein [Chitinolyticbacter meiyuanensis]